MDSLSYKSIDPWRDCPAWLRAAVSPQLSPTEHPLAWRQLDLDRNRHYRQGYLVLTDQRLWSAEPADAAPGSPLPLVHWPLAADATLRLTEAEGVGDLELLGPFQRIAHWSFSAGRAASVKRLFDRWTLWRRSHDAEGVKLSDIEYVACPRCGAEMLPEQPCPECAEPGPPQARTLFRLLGFAKQRAGMALLGILLAVAATAVALIPTCLTIPLYNRVLIPFAKGDAYESHLVPYLLGGIGAAAVLAWAIGWARTYVLAWVTERIGSNLRELDAASRKTLERYL